MAARTILMAASALAARRASALAPTFFVDCTTGSDANDGTSAATPFASPTRARDAVRALPRPLPAGGVLVSIAPGVCAPLNNDFSQPVLSLSWDANDSGDGPDAPVVWAGAAPGAVLSAGLALPTSPIAWSPIPASPGCFSTPLRGVPGFNTSAMPGLGALVASPCASPTTKAALVVDGELTTPARWPNIGVEWEWMYATNTTPVADGGGSITVNTTRPLDRAWPANATWLHGFWVYDWADSYVRLAAVTPCAGSAPDCAVLHVDPATPPAYGAFEPRCRLMAVDIAQELDAPGESFVDPAALTVSYCPAGGAVAGGVVAPFLTMGDYALDVAGTDPPGRLVHDVQFVNMTIAHSRRAGARLIGVSRIALVGLDVQGHGGGGIEVANAWDSLLEGMAVRSVGCSGVSVQGGDEATLAPSGTVMRGANVSDFARVVRAYQPGIAWSGVGLAFVGNEVSDGPHSGILGSGNDVRFEGNYLHDLCYEATDSGGFYLGRSWVHRNISIVGNTFERIFVRETPFLGSPAINCVYFDDMQSGMLLADNVFRGCFHGLLLGGGRDNTVTNNSFSNMTGGYAVTFDARGLGWSAASCFHNDTDPAASGNMVLGLFAVNYSQPPYSRYAGLPGILDGDAQCTPAGNNVSGNTYCGAAKGFMDTNASQAAAWGSYVADNVERC